MIIACPKCTFIKYKSSGGCVFQLCSKYIFHILQEVYLVATARWLQITDDLLSINTTVKPVILRATIQTHGNKSIYLCKNIFHFSNLMAIFVQTSSYLRSLLLFKRMQKYLSGLFICCSADKTALKITCNLIMLHGLLNLAWLPHNQGIKCNHIPYIL